MTFLGHIWAADLKQLYRLIDTRGLDQGRRQKVDTERTKILASRGTESVFTVFMGADQPPEHFGSIAQAHFFYTPSRTGLGTLQRSDLQQMLNTWPAISKEDVLKWLDQFIRLNTFEISVPVLSDPEAAPEGKTGVIASLLLDHRLVKNIADDGWYDEFEAVAETTIIDVLSDSIYPGLRDNLLFGFSAGPLSIEKRVRSSEGAIVGWSLEEPIPIDAGILNMKNSVRTALPDVFKAGQWAASPAGIPTYIMTAKLAADLVLKEISQGAHWWHPRRPLRRSS